MTKNNSTTTTMTATQRAIAVSKMQRKAQWLKQAKEYQVVGAIIPRP